jgi:hypothetical protein
VITGLREYKPNGADGHDESSAGMLFKAKVRMARQLCIEKFNVKPALQSVQPDVSLGLQQVQSQMSVLAAALVAPGVQVPSTQAASSVAVRKIKLKEIVDQMSEEEAEAMTDTRIAQCWAQYETLFGVGEKPEKGEEPSYDQLAAIDHMLRMNVLPYVDFGIFGPFGTSMIKKVKLQGIRLNSEGQITKIEINGPATYDLWCASWMVFQTSLTMLDAVDLGKLLSYKRRMDRYYQAHGEKVWGLLYQTDVRTRGEHFIRVRREGLAAYNAAWFEMVTLHGEQEAARRFKHPYDPKRPWDYVFGQIQKEAQWWLEEIELPILHFYRKTDISKVIEGDVEVEKASGRVGGKRPVPSPDLSGASAGTVQNAAQGAGKKSRGTRQHNVSNGHYLTNRTGVELCEAYNWGRCPQTVGNNLCPKDQSKLHLCSKCLQPGHTAATCEQVPQMSRHAD